MKLSCCIWALSDPIEMILTRVADIGFTHIDIRAIDLTTSAAQAQVKALNLAVVCMGLAFGLPETAALDSPEDSARAQVVDLMRDSLIRAAQLGATDAYLIPSLDTSAAALDRFAQSLVVLGSHAAELGIRLSIEHFPGRVLPTIADTLDFLARLDHPNLYLLFDIGHAQISNEDPAEAIRKAGSRLGYVHLDDNDGQGDLHWALFDGLLTEAVLKQTLAALDEIGYTGGVSLELSPRLADPLTALSRGHEIVRSLGQF
jgi:sugar phosphate isomerase/epimerase